MFLKMSSQSYRSSEKGNVLFLILIAVALFAALSYSVTQSTRSGSGSTEREKAILSSASMTQHPTAMRTALIRMVLGGVDVTDLKFNATADFGSLTQAELVFHPQGGGAVSQLAPGDLMVGGENGTWFYNASWQIPDIGTNGPSGNDIIAFLPGITQAVCRQTNTEFTIDLEQCDISNGNVPLLQTAASTHTNIPLLADDTYTFPTTTQQDIQGEDSGGTCTAFTGQPSGCFYDPDVVDPTGSAGSYVFYSVLLER